MKEIDISNIEELILAKANIESKLKENDDGYKPMKLEDFISEYISLKNVLFDNGKLIPFSIVDVCGDKYLLYSSDTEGSLESVKAHMDSIGYDLSKLKELTYSEMVMKLDTLKVYYMIDSKFYVE